MIYAVYTTETFKKEMEKLPNDYQEQIKNIFLQIKDNPYVGDALRTKILREKRIKEKRVYYLIFDDLKSILVVAISGKKNQQETINHLLKYINEYRSYLESLLKSN